MENGIKQPSTKDVSALLDQGGTLLYPTDTIYGLGCDALQPSAVANIQQAKGREPGKPFLILAGSLEKVQEHFEFPVPVQQGLAELWPGPYTVLLEPNEDFQTQIPDSLVGPTGKVGVRVPKMEEGRFLHQLFQKWDGLLVSTSANLAGEPYQGDWGELQKLFCDRVDSLIQESENGKESAPSALLDWDGEQGEWKVLRPGKETEEELLRRLLL